MVRRLVASAVAASGLARLAAGTSQIVSGSPLSSVLPAAVILMLHGNVFLQPADASTRKVQFSL